MSDISHFGGMPDGINEDQFGQKVMMKNEGVWLESGEYLYGAWRNLTQCILNSIQKKLINMKDALTLASRKPLTFFTVENDFMLKVGKKTPIILFNEDTLDFELVN